MLLYAAHHDEPTERATSSRRFESCYWGKAQPRDPGGPAWHPLAYHSLDVAAAMDALLDVRPRLLAAVADIAGLSLVEARRMLCFVAAVHDLGKFGDDFQIKVPHLWQGRASYLAERRHAEPPRGSGHGVLGEVAGAALPEVRDFDLEIVPELAEVVHSGDEAQHPARLDEAKAGDIGHCRKQPRPDIEQGVHRGGHVEGMVGQRMPGRSARIARLRLSPIAALKSSGRRRSLRRLVMVRRVQQYEDTSRLNRLEIATIRPNFRSGGVARGFPQHQTEVEDQARARMA